MRQAHQVQCHVHQELVTIHLVQVVADHVHLLDQFVLVKLEELLENYNQDNVHQCQVHVLVLSGQVLQHDHHQEMPDQTLVLLHLLVPVEHQTLHTVHHLHHHLVHHLAEKAADVHHNVVVPQVHLAKAEKVRAKVADKRVRKKDAKILKIYQHHN
jgi:hypothetical protein